MSIKNRLAFVVGFIEADGNVGMGRKITAATVSHDLAYGVANLFNSLGFLAKVRESKSVTNFGPTRVFKISFPNIFKQLDVNIVKNINKQSPILVFELKNIQIMTDYESWVTYSDWVSAGDRPLPSWAKKVLRKINEIGKTKSRGNLLRALNATD